MSAHLVSPHLRVAAVDGPRTRALSAAVPATHVASMKTIHANIIAGKDAEIGALQASARDSAQSYAAELSEAARRLAQLGDDSNRLFKDNSQMRLQVGVAKQAAAAASDALSDAQRTHTLREQELRRCEVKLGLYERQASLYTSHVPLKDFQALERKVQVEQERVAHLVGRVAELEAELAPCDEPASSCDEEGTSGWRGGGWDAAARLRREAGLETNRFAPRRTYAGDSSKPTGESNWEKRSVRHIAAVIRGRPVAHVVAALARLEQQEAHPCLTDVAAAESFQGVVRGIVQESVDLVADHWSARLSVHIWDRLELSRSNMEVLRHLLSFIYEPLTDSYDPIVAWTNPHDSHDVVLAACLVGRYSREKLYHELVADCEITVGDNGRCERDAVVLTSALYTNYRKALRTDYTLTRPAHPILFFDGTGGSLGKGVCHAEIGSADFLGDCLQSRATLSPLALYEGNDHALPLRANMRLAVDSFNRMIREAIIRRGDGECLPCQPLVVGDMQGIKCIFGMAEKCHSVWCKCRDNWTGLGKRDGHHRYGDTDFLPLSRRCTSTSSASDASSRTRIFSWRVHIFQRGCGTGESLPLSNAPTQSVATNRMRCRRGLTYSAMRL